MHTDHGSIHHDRFKVCIFREKLEDLLERSALDPAAKTLENRIPNHCCPAILQLAWGKVLCSNEKAVFMGVTDLN